MPGNGERRSDVSRAANSNANIISWSSVVEGLTRQMFVRDARGRTIFFPWGPRGKGFILKSVRRRSTIAGFYTGGLIAYFAITLIAIGGAADSWQIIGGFAVCSAIWLAIWFLYARGITRSLPAAQGTYSEIALEKLTEDASRYASTESDLSHTAQNYVSPPARSEALLALKALYYRLSASQLAAASWIVLAIIALIWYSLHPSIFEGKYGNYLGAAVLCLFGGLGSFFIAWRAETSGTWQFINWRLPHFLACAVCWSGTVFLLFKYIAR